MRAKKEGRKRKRKQKEGKGKKKIDILPSSIQELSVSRSDSRPGWKTESLVVG